MRISDWSSDVCSSDLAKAAHAASQAKLQTNLALTAGTSIEAHPDVMQAADQLRKAWLANSRTRLPAPVDGMIAPRSVQVGQHEIGRESCREECVRTCRSRWSP